MPLALLLTTTAATVVGAAALRSLYGVRKQLTALRAELAEGRMAFVRATVPAARTTSDADAIRLAVAAALADERERELAEARAFWAAQEARDATDAPSLLGLPLDDVYLPRPSDFAGLEPVAEPASDVDDFAGESPELAAARRRHPSHPDFVPAQTRGTDDHERTVTRLGELAESGTALADVRPGPLGTLDVYVFADGTTLCMTPGHRDTAERLASALRGGEAPVLLGGSAVSGAYALTFACGDENVFVLADRVIASL
ncbi:hypothetical protein [Streptomyces himalayensis]|uniref:Secreted protein n=1 Tax=Streptomyces himalayensis subsp. himalayensis TaxID=2756131 RepID=A0A7W0DT07_9ACTN|nr:hypothetical protein [Streptomyces himalayensis]MBA2949884.1 hypothetical protein [Streptomyces himalayensis subsp. himalayensis]